MTREEAITYITEWLKDEYALNGLDIEVLNMAKEALQQRGLEIEYWTSALLDIEVVVRCKDCRHRYYADNRVPHERTWVCERFANEEITDNDFCSWGERREP